LKSPGCGHDGSCPRCTLGKNIVLETPGGGSSITINKAGIEIKSDGNVTVNGAVVMLNCD